MSVMFAKTPTLPKKTVSFGSQAWPRPALRLASSLKVQCEHWFGGHGFSGGWTRKLRL